MSKIESCVLLMFWMLAVSLIPSCSAGGRGLEDRRAFAVHFYKERLASSKSEVSAKWCNDALAALSSTNSAVVANPQLISVILTKGKNGTYGLFVLWIEEDPTVDGVEFAFHEDSLPAIDLKLEVDTKQLREAAKETIVFGSEQDWGDSSETWKSLEQINTTKSLKVRLLRGTTPVTDWHPVDCYKDGAWVSDQAVKK